MWSAFKLLLADVLSTLHGLLEPVAGRYGWAAAIIALTFAMRLALVPLAVKTQRGSRRMQALQPELAKIRTRYAIDRKVATTDPERYRKQKAKEQKASMELLKTHRSSPLAALVPALIQVPIFLALFQVLRGGEDALVPELATAPFYGISSLGASLVGGAGAGALLLIAVYVASAGITPLLSLRNGEFSQMSPAGAQPPMVQNIQRNLAIGLPIMLGVFAVGFPSGVVLYWTASSLWLAVQTQVLRKAIPAMTFAQLQDLTREREAARRTRAADGDA